MNRRKYKGISTFELLVFMLIFGVGFAMANYLGQKFGYVGMIIGFPLGISLVIGVFYLFTRRFK